MTPANIIRLAWACAVLVVILTVGGIGYRLGSSHSRIALAEYKKAAAEQTAKDADKLAKLTQEYRETERKHAETLNDVATQYEADKRAIETNADRLVADLRAGNRKLRDEWQGCKASVSSASPGASGADGQDRLREESIGRVLEWVGTLQAQRDGLQAVTQSDRQ